MNEMIERVAQAMMDSDYSEDGAPVNIHFGILARAAIAAMREPTEEMMNVACDGPSKRARECWKCMIDEALK